MKTKYAIPDKWKRIKNNEIERKMSVWIKENMYEIKITREKSESWFCIAPKRTYQIKAKYRRIRFKIGRKISFEKKKIGENVARDYKINHRIYLYNKTEAQGLLFGASVCFEARTARQAASSAVTTTLARPVSALQNLPETISFPNAQIWFPASAILYPGTRRCCGFQTLL